MKPAQDFHALAFRPAHARRILLEVAQRYARLWLVDTATVRDAPKLKDGQDVLLADYRFTLEAATGGAELPPIPEPEWPVRYRMSDWVPGKDLRAEPRKGARRAPTWTNQAAGAAAEAWAAAFVAQLLDAPQDERAALADESREKMLDYLTEGAGGGS